MNPNARGTPTAPPPNNAGAPSGDDSPRGPVTSADLEAALSGVSPTAPNEDDAPIAAAQVAPEDAAPAQPAPGQEAEPQETPTADGEPAAAGEEDTVLSQSNEELNQAFVGLSPAQRQHALELVKSLQPGEIPRISQLLSRTHQAQEKITELTAEVDRLKATSVAAHAPDGAGLPETVAKLNTVQEVSKRVQEVKGHVRDLKLWLMDNPQGGTIGEREVTASQVQKRIFECEDELEALPQRAQQITQQSQFQSRQQDLVQKLEAEFPHLIDSEHAETKAVSVMLKQNPWLNDFPNPKFEALVRVRGLQSVNADYSKRHPASPATGPVSKALQQQRPAGKVEARKPLIATTGAPPKAMDQRKALETAMPKPGSRVRTDDLENVLSFAVRR